MRQYELVEQVKAYDPNADEELLNRAYVFAMKAHGVQKRASGDPYFSHPVEVAGILAGLRLDAASIATGLLHDTVEDTGATLETLRKLFGDEVVRLVDGVTKLNKLELQSPNTAQAENFRKLLLAMSDDIRVLLVKLADRLHNMRTLHFVPKPDKRQRIATETIEIYAPLAERIGMSQMKDELEDLAFAELWPDARESIVNRLAQLREHDDDLVGRIVSELTETLRRAGIAAAVAGREKAPISIWRKMQRKNISFEQLADIMAFRVLVDTVPDCYGALGSVHAAYTMIPGRFKDYISTPKPNGYRSLHTTVIGPQKRRIEVQIRTHEQHEQAQLGVAAHWAYKQQDGRVHEGRQYRWIRELLDVLEHAAGPEEFLECTKLEMFQDQVFCFTPAGDLIALPRGSTPVDFAYAVHSEVGDATIGAKVNDRMVQLRAQLSNGDQVEILTSKNAAPSPAWERFVVTGKARTRIRRYWRIRKRGEYVAVGRELLQRAAERERLVLSERLLERVLKPLQQKSIDDLLALVGEGSVAPRQVLDAVRPAPPAADEDKVVPLRRTRRATPGNVTAPRVDGPVAGVAIHYAGCCRPVPGEQIVGIACTGRGISVHARDCGNLERFAGEPERWLDLSWDELRREARAGARLRAALTNRPGSLGALSTAIGKQGGNITDVRFHRRTPELTEMSVDLEVEDIEHLRRIIAALRATAVVASVERARG